MRSKQKKRRIEAAAPSPPPATGSWLVPCVLLFCGVFLLHAGSYHYPLVFDDTTLLGTPELSRMAEYCAGLRNRCISYTTFGLTYLAVGLDLFWFRAGNVLCHALAVLACFQFLDRLFAAAGAGDDGTGRGRLIAFCGAVWFAVHPITVYGVTYLAQRSIVMATLFSFLSLTAFVRALTDGGRRWLWLSVLLYGLALLSKEHAVMLPAVALAIAILLGKLPAGSRMELTAVAAVFAAAAAFVSWRLLDQGFIGMAPEYYVRELHALRGTAFDPQAAFLGSVVTQMGLFFKYMILFIFPYPGWMSVDLRPLIADGPFAWPYILGAPVFLAWGIASATLLTRRGATGLLGLGMLFPWLLFFTEFASARLQEPLVLYRGYLWMAGLPLVFPYLLRRLPARAIVTGCVIVAIVFGVAMRERLVTFASDLALWEDAVRKSADAQRVFTDRGYVNRAFTLMRAGRLDEALRDIETALRLNPGNTHAYLNRGTIRSRRGDQAGALADFDRSIALDPAFAEGHSERCAVLIIVEQPERARESCDAALRLAPRLAKARINRAVLNARSGRMAEALSDLDEAVKLDPANGYALYNRALVYRETGRAADSIGDLRTSCSSGFTPACAELR
jgi:protein O-mannosyl-transferase